MHTVKLLIANNITVNIIIGYKGNLIKEELKGLNVNFLENPFYKVTNSIASLWFARDLLKDDDVLLANADVFYTQELLDIVIKEKRDIMMLADSTRIYEGDYFFKCNNNILVDYGKELKEKDRTSEYVGIAKIRKSFLPTLKEQLVRLIENGDYNYWWENTLYSIIDTVNVNVKDVDGLFWGEVDTKEDYNRILNYLNQNNN